MTWLRGKAGRVLRVAVVAVAPLLVAEAALRVAGYHPRVDWYFQEFERHDDVFERDGDRFVVAPDRRATFRAEPFPAVKPAGAPRVMSVGDSITWGFRGNDAAGPLDAYSDDLQGLLRDRYGPAAQVVNCGARTYGSGRVLAVLRDVVRYDPDVVLAYSGTSDFLEAATRAAWRARLDRSPAWLWHLRVAGFLADRFQKAGGGEAGLDAAGLRARDEYLRAPFVDPGQVVDEAARERVIAGFGQDVADMVVACAHKDVPLVLMTVPSNLRWPPFASTGRDPESDEAVRRAGDMLQRGDADGAIALVRPLVATHLGSAALHYRLAQALDAKGDAAAARTEYLAARDDDAFPLRAIGAINREIRDSGSRRGVVVVDVERLFESMVPDGIPDDRLFVDHCHPTAEVHRRIAQAVMKALVERGLVPPVPGAGGAR